MSKENLVLFLNTSKISQLRRLAEELQIVNDDDYFDEFLIFLKELIRKREK